MVGVIVIPWSFCIGHRRTGVAIYQAAVACAPLAFHRRCWSAIAAPARQRERSAGIGRGLGVEHGGDSPEEVHFIRAIGDKTAVRREIAKI